MRAKSRGLAVGGGIKESAPAAWCVIRARVSREIERFGKTGVVDWTRGESSRRPVRRARSLPPLMSGGRATGGRDAQQDGQSGDQEASRKSSHGITSGPSLGERRFHSRRFKIITRSGLLPFQKREAKSQGATRFFLEPVRYAEASGHGFEYEPRGTHEPNSMFPIGKRGMTLITRSNLWYAPLA